MLPNGKLKEKHLSILAPLQPGEKKRLPSNFHNNLE
jgi:hypothetical protein